MHHMVLLNLPFYSSCSCLYSSCFPYLGECAYPYIQILLILRGQFQNVSCSMKSSLVFSSSSLPTPFLTIKMICIFLVCFVEHLQRAGGFFVCLFLGFFGHIACRILVPQTRDRTRAPCSGSVES